MLAVPPIVFDVVGTQLAAEIAAGQALRPPFRIGVSGGSVAEFAISVRPGMRSTAHTSTGRRNRRTRVAGVTLGEPGGGVSTFRSEQPEVPGPR